MNAVAPSLFDEVDPDSIEGRFLAFHARHPEVAEQLRILALDLLDRGWRHLGIGMLYETVRYFSMLGATPEEGEPYRLNNDYRSRYARLLEETEPRLSGVFETRRLTAP